MLNISHIEEFFELMKGLMKPEMTRYTLFLVLNELRLRIFLSNKFFLTWKYQFRKETNTLIRFVIFFVKVGFKTLDQFKITTTKFKDFFGGK